MKCFNCGCEIKEEKICPECGYDLGEKIKVNRRSGDEVLFESELIQTLYNHTGIFKNDTSNLIRDLNSNVFKKHVDGIDIEEIGVNVLDSAGDIFDDVSELAYEILPDLAEELSMDAKIALNRDEDYVRKARRKLKIINSSDNCESEMMYARIIHLCDKAIEVNRRNHEAYYLKGIALINLKRYDEGIEELISSMAISGDKIDVRLEIANANRLNKEFDDAISVYDSVLKIDESSYEAFKGKAHTYFDACDYENADEMFKKASSLKSLDKVSLSMWEESLEKLA